VTIERGAANLNAAPLWWQVGVVYQVYPRSLQDSNGDGIGDLRGIIDRLDHFVWLGVDAIWISPIFRSPMADFGYDISDYRDVDPTFGTLADLDLLVAEAHRRGLRVLLDYVPNHTSIEHAWFRESRSSRDNPRRDWYVWADPKPDGSPPNNWLSIFGGSAWQFDRATGQYYLHLFLKEQPDLNWRNPLVRAEMYDTLRFWLDRGIDGFRIDVLWLLIKDDQLRDNPPNPAFLGAGGGFAYDALLPEFTSDRPEMHDVVAEMRAVLDEYDERVMIAEIYLPTERLVTYYGSADRPEAHLPFNFQLVLSQWKAPVVGKALREYEAALPDHGWPNWVLGNHDQPRIATRAGRDQAAVAAMLLVTVRGTPTIYYGDEIGMSDVDIPEELRLDPARFEGPTSGGRDAQRTPMRWDGSANGGFTTGEPWLPIGDDVERINVAVQSTDEQSLLSLYRRLLELRRDEPALRSGSWAEMLVTDEVLVYERVTADRRLVVALNFSATPQQVTLDLTGGRVLLSTDRSRDGEEVGSPLDLRPNEGLVLVAS
jgi:alpha-glucosidase